MTEQQSTEQNKQESQFASDGIANSLADQSTIGQQNSAAADQPNAQKNNPPAIQDRAIEVVEKTEEDLRRFERESLDISRDMLDISRSAYRIAIFAFCAAACAAIFVGVQVKIMSYQTQILASQSESATAGSILDEMNTRKQLNLAQRQVEALENQVSTMRLNFGAEQQPFIWITNSNSGIGWDEAVKKGAWTDYYSNYGHSPARYTIDSVLEVGGDAMKKAQEHEMNAPSLKLATSKLPQGKVDYFTAYSSVTKEQWDEALVHDGWMVLVGTFIYYDTSGHAYTTDFCNFRFSNGAIGNCFYQHKIKHAKPN